MEIKAGCGGAVPAPALPRLKCCCAEREINRRNPNCSRGRELELAPSVHFPHLWELRGWRPGWHTHSTSQQLLLGASAVQILSAQPGVGARVSQGLPGPTVPGAFTSEGRKWFEGWFFTKNHGCFEQGKLCCSRAL